MAAYYNEIDPFAAAWLRELITTGHIAPGDVDTRSIVDVRPSDLLGYAQCHFFAGIGVWSYSLRRAGWADDRPVWTGSCPCQPFSAAGKGGGFDDERHLWPAFYHLIGECGPAVVFGEQVASKDADPWIDLVQTDMEAMGYAFGAVPFPSAGVGAPHIRDRTYWLADANGSARREGRADVRGRSDRGNAEPWSGLGGGVPDRLDDTASARHVGAFGIAEGDPRDEARLRLSDARRETSGLDDDDDTRLEGQRGRHRAEIGQRQGSVRSVAAAGELGWVGNAVVATRERDAGSVPGAEAPIDGERVGVDGRLPVGPEHASAGMGRMVNTDGRDASAERQQRGGEQRQQPEDGRALHNGSAGPTNGFWRNADWLHCRDVKWRPVEPGSFPLAHGAPARVGRLRGYGNAINAVAAETFITAYLEKDVVEIDAERLRLTGAFA